MIKAQVSCECSEFAVWYFVSHQTTSKGHGVDRAVGEFRALVALESGLDKREIESNVVSDDDRITDELKE
jgi:hypothetical protein